MVKAYFFIIIYGIGWEGGRSGKKVDFFGEYVCLIEFLGFVTQKNDKRGQ